MPRGSSAPIATSSSLLPSDVPVIAAVNKVDLLPDKSALLPRMAEIARLHAFAAIVPVSAERGTQLPALKAEIAKRCRSRRRCIPADDVTDRDERFLAAEFIREKIFRLLGEEVPYATTVAIDKFEVEGATAPHLRDRVRRQGEVSAPSCSAKAARA